MDGFKQSNSFFFSFSIFKLFFNYINPPIVNFINKFVVKEKY